MLPKTRRLRQLFEARGLDPIIEVDGGENRESAGQAIEAGANAIVAGSAIFRSPDLCRRDRRYPRRLAVDREGTQMISASKAKVEVLADPEALSRRVADWVLELAMAKDGEFAVALSGGSTPQGLYERLAGPPYIDAFPWFRTHWFWGDERFVPHDNPLSNYRMVREALLSRAPIPAINIHSIPTEGLSPEASASAYASDLKSFYGTERLDPARPLFDVNLLGLGSDGHTASLFPGTAALTERDRWVTAVIGAKAEARITLTYPTLESSRHTAFLVAGKGKRAIFDRLRRGDDSLPAAHLRPTGTLCIFGDVAAVAIG